MVHSIGILQEVPLNTTTGSKIRDFDFRGQRFHVEISGADEMTQCSFKLLRFSENHMPLAWQGMCAVIEISALNKFSKNIKDGFFRLEVKDPVICLESGKMNSKNHKYYHQLMACCTILVPAEKDLLLDIDYLDKVTRRMIKNGHRQ